MDAVTRNLVRTRAANCCEYCRLPQSAAPFLRFHIEHVQAQQHIADDSPENLALACPDCNRHKGPNLVTLDPVSRDVVRLFHPRQDRWQDRWQDHFEFRGAILLGRTVIGESTIRLLQMNTVDRVEMRAELKMAGEM